MSMLLLSLEGDASADSPMKPPNIRSPTLFSGRRLSSSFVAYRMPRTALPASEVSATLKSVVPPPDTHFGENVLHE